MKKTRKMAFILPLILLSISLSCIAQQAPLETIAQESRDPEESMPSDSKSAVERQQTTSSTDSQGSSSPSQTASSPSNSPTPLSQESKAFTEHNQNLAHIDYAPLPIALRHERAIEDIFKKYLAIIDSNPNPKKKQQQLDTFFNKLVPQLYRQYIAQHFNQTSKMRKHHNEDAYKLALAAQKGFQQRWGFNVFKKVDEQFRQKYNMQPIKDYNAFFSL